MVIMAKSKGFLEYRGTLHGVTGVHSKEGHYLRAKQDIPKERYQTAGEYEAFRANGQLMARAAKLSKAMRTALGAYTDNVSNTRMYSRLNAAMRKVVQGGADDISALVGFEFHRDRPLSSVLRSLYHVETTADGTRVVLRDMHPAGPKGAVYVLVSASLLCVDAEEGTFTFEEGPTTTLVIGSVYPEEVTCEPSASESTEPRGLVLLRVSFADSSGGTVREIGGGMRIIATV